MSDPEPRYEIPLERLPRGFAEGITHPVDDPAPPRPAATVVLLRDPDPRGGKGDGPEVLLLRRAHTVGFVPGAYVFPGGRVDRSDGDDAVLRHLTGVEPANLARRMGHMPHGSPPAAAYLVAAFRETFEETGILPGVDAARLAGSETARLRDRLLADEIPFHGVLDALDARLDAASAAYIAHWVTPRVEPRRYDTRFFALRVSRGLPVTLRGAESTHALWLTPALALQRHERGELPMIFPTIRTLEALAEFATAGEVLEAYERRTVPRILPRLVRTSTGVEIVVPDPPASEP